MMQLERFFGVALIVAISLSTTAVAQQGPPSSTRVIPSQQRPDSSGSAIDDAGGLTPAKREAFAKANPEDITDENFPEVIESFDYPNADIQEVVKAISKLTGKNFIIEDNVRGKITIIAPSAITVAEAYRAFLSALAINGLTVVPSGKFLKIRQTQAARRDSIETYAGSYFPNTDQVITRIIKLKYISADEVFKNLRSLQTKDGDINPYPPTNSLIISDYGTNVERIQNILNELDVPGFEEKLSVIRIKYAKASDIADLIDQIINKGEGGRGGRSGNRFGVPRFRPTTPGAPGASTSGGSGAETYSLVVPDERTNSIIVVGNQAGIDKIKGLVKKLDFRMRPEDQGGVHVYYVRHGEAEQIANVLNGIANEAKKNQQQQQQGGPGSIPPPLGFPAGPTGERDLGGAIFGGSVQVTADKSTNSLIVVASRQDYETVRNLLSKVDISRDQVFVKAIIMEMSAKKGNNWGVDYYKFMPGTNGVGRFGFRTSDITSILNPAGDSGAVLGFGAGSMISINPMAGATTGTTGAVAGGINVTDFISFFKFLQTNTNTNILSTPQLTALDNEQAVIEVGEQVPVNVASQIGVGGVAAQNVQRENATIKLELTPSISPDTDTVRLKIDQQVKEVSPEPPKAAQLSQVAIALRTRQIKTVIVMDSGDTSVLGGLMRDEDIINQTKVPILGDIPLLGWLFKGKKTDRHKTNLLVFITPKIIRGAKDNAEVVSSKINERVDFIQRALNGTDPFGAEVDALPRKASAGSGSSEEGMEEEPAAETF